MLSLSWDVETASELDLKVVGSRKYMMHHSTRLLMVAWKWSNDSTIYQWSEDEGRALPSDLLQAIAHPDVRKYAFNADFEIYASEYLMRIEPALESWRCTMAMAAMCGIGGTLSSVGEALGIASDKKKAAAGKALITLFCTPPTPGKPNSRRGTWQTHADKWAQFRDYNRQDVVAEDTIRQELEKIEQDPREWDLWLIDRRINRAGVPIDLGFVRGAHDMLGQHIETVTQRVERLTGGIAPGTTDAFREFVVMHGGPGSLAEQERAAALAGDRLDEAGRAALQAFDDISSASVKKYGKMLDMEVGACLHGQLTFCGADQSGRWSSKGAQLQNMPHPTLKGLDQIKVARQIIAGRDYAALEAFGFAPLDALISTVRTAVAAPAGFQVNVCDLSTIEPRTAAWSTGCKRMLNVFETGRDCYKDFGSTLFATEYDRIDKKQRQDSKPGFLGCGYGLGAATLIAQAAAQGNVISQELAARSIEAYAEAYPEVLTAWKDHESAVKASIQEPGEWWPVGPYQWAVIGRFLTCRLPSGRCIRWLDPRLERNTDQRSWKYGRLEITAQGSRFRVSLYGSNLFAVLNQATARDVLGEAMRACQDAGEDIRLHVHDELVTISPEGDGGEKRLEHLMTRPISWLPGVTLKAEAVAYRFYSKL